VFVFYDLFIKYAAFLISYFVLFFFFLWSLSVFRLLTLHFNTYRLGSPAKKPGCLVLPIILLPFSAYGKWKAYVRVRPWISPKILFINFCAHTLNESPPLLFMQWKRAIAARVSGCLIADLCSV